MSEAQFTLPVEIDLAATFLFGLTGALAAMKRGYDVIGLFALAFVTALGGGLIRDGIFIQNGPPAVAADSLYIMIVVVSGVVAVLFREHVPRFAKIIAWVDALGLGAYAVIGVQKSLAAGLSVAAAVLVGMINASGGGLMRDVLVREEPLLFKPGQYYTLAALAGCVLFVVLVLRFHLPMTKAAFITIGATFVFRILTIQFNWRSRPVLAVTSEPPSV